ncbi:class I SAM-dependent methyltransferase [Amycolatopsis sp. NPDC059027]|uniref:class I SAM-dependent methyltransferase n=1 Tax=Amycolatopsis sp. NPDC059027 TaxID=3346709 RepID=UPI00366EF237
MALYDEIGVGYASQRRTDSRWLSAILDALDGAGTVLDVGSGTGSYAPPGRTVLAVEPSVAMIRQRPAGAPPVVRAVAEALPVVDNAADAALAVLTVHHWTDWRRGLAELRRVAPLRVVLAYDTARVGDFWMVRDYLPEILRLELSRPSAAAIADALGTDVVVPMPVPWDFTDGIFLANWRRPGAYLDPRVRQAASAFAQTPAAVVERGIARLRADLDSGRWHENNAELLGKDEYDAGFSLVVSRA